MKIVRCLLLGPLWTFLFCLLQLKNKELRTENKKTRRILTRIEV